MTEPTSQSSVPNTDAAAQLSDAELAAYVRSSLIRAGLVLVLLVGGLAFVGKLWEAELLATVKWVMGNLGLPGLCGLLFIGDSLVTPLPPDALLVVVAKADMGSRWAVAVGAFGMVSVVAGNTAWWMGKHAGKTRIPRAYLRRFGRKPQALVKRYGRRAVAIGALTPVPFSVTCWAAGMLDMPWREFWVVTLLRIPRFYLYYLLIFWI